MSILLKITSAVIVFFWLSCKANSQNEPPEDHCLVMNEIPKNVSHVANIAGKNEPGERIKIKGTLYESDGKTPAKNVIMYFYHTNAKGIYAKHGNEPRSSFAWWHGYNRGWLKTNEHGAYEINTIRPVPYPRRADPAHIHCIVKAPTQKQCYYIGDFVFKDDPLATEKYWYQVERSGNPRDGGVEMSKPQNGVSVGIKNITLYAQHDIASASSGLNIGENCPAFDPYHVWGADKGSRACPMCKYGYRPGVMAWINTDNWQNVSKLAKALDAEIAAKGFSKLRAFIIYMNPDKLTNEAAEKKLVAFSETAGLKNVAVLFVPSAVDKTTATLYRINPATTIRNTIIVYKNRKVQDKYINFDANDKSLRNLFNKLDNFQ